MGAIFYINCASSLSLIVTTYSRMSPPFRMWKTSQWEAQLNGSSGFSLGLDTHLCTVWLRLPSRNALSLDTILHESLSLFVITSNPHAPLSDLLFPQKSRKYALNKQTNPLTKIDVFRAALPKFSFKLVFNKIPAKMLICNSSQLFYWNQFEAKHFLNAYKATKIINNVWLSFKPWGIQSPNSRKNKKTSLKRKQTWKRLLLGEWLLPRNQREEIHVRKLQVVTTTARKLGHKRESYWMGSYKSSHLAAAFQLLLLLFNKFSSLFWINF